MKISIITLQYNKAYLTIKCLASLVPQRADVQLIAVDNASKTGEFHKLRDYCQEQQITLIQNEQNLGFAGGVNTGIRQALNQGTEWLVLLNNDTWVESDFIARLEAKLSVLEGLPGHKTNIIGGLALDEGGQMAYTGKIEWLKPTLRHLYSIPDSRFHLLDSGLYVIGGGMVIHKSVFEKIGYFDPNYFLYFEDADFSLRARRAGMPILFAPDLIVHHSVSQSTKALGAPLLLRYHYRNALYFNYKFGDPWIRAAVWFWSVGIIWKQMLKLLLNIHREESHAILRGAIDFLNGATGKISWISKQG